MLRRKITNRIEEFYKSNPKKALMIVGARQVGKSYAIGKFAEAHYESVITIDFIENPEYVSVFENAQGADEILLRLSAVFGDRMIPGKTMIFFDEVQECRELITQIKYLVQEGTYAYILSGSLLGTVFKDIVSAPVGYMDIATMRQARKMNRHSGLPEKRVPFLLHAVGCRLVTHRCIRRPRDSRLSVLPGPCRIQRAYTQRSRRAQVRRSAYL